jgi:uncharacterized 2Fe-2S/4Fe-4S cluster protein (DUF4445 family)
LSSAKQPGIAVDLGTTTIAAALVEAGSGAYLARSGSINPQRQYGADVVSRLAYAGQGEAQRRALQECCSGELERLAQQVAAAAGVPLDRVGQVAVAGNPTMVHLLLGLPVEPLAFPPYRPKVTTGHTLTTGQLGWATVLPLYVWPSPGGFVGGDLVAFLYGEELAAAGTPAAGPRLYLDLGTNGEIALWTAAGWFATSAAAGPAFEGGNLACGMAALPGAIERVTLSGDRLTCTTIGNGQPLGLCGSGVLEAIAALRAGGVLDASGRLKAPAEIPTNLAARVQEIAGQAAFVFYRDARRQIYLSQDDIRQVQLAKGAVRAGIEVLLERARIRPEAVPEVVLTGSFGASLTLASLKSIGILTENMVINARFVREGALAGVARSLGSAAALHRVEQLAAALKIIPLSGTPAFEQKFLAHLNFPG